MRFNPADAKDSGGSFKPGTYRFSVVNAEERTARESGNEMIALTLSVNIDGQAVNVFDHLVNTPNGLWKPKTFCKEVGIDFDAGELTARMCMDKAGRVELNYDPKDLAKVKAGTLGRAYLKVVRYGVHEDAPGEKLNPGDTGERLPQEPGMPIDDDDSIPF